MIRRKRKTELDEKAVLREQLRDTEAARSGAVIVQGELHDRIRELESALRTRTEERDALKDLQASTRHNAVVAAEQAEKFRAERDAFSAQLRVRTAERDALRRFIEEARQEEEQDEIDDRR